MSKLIEKNTTIPTKRSEIFSTAEDNQPGVQVQVYQGEREIAKANKRLGNFELTGIAPAPRGIPQIEVVFDIDANGILHVSAKDLGTGKEQKIIISGGSSLSKEEIANMIKDAEVHAEDDKKRREEAEARNVGESLLYQTEKFVKENSEKLSQGDSASKKAEVENAISDLKNALEGSNLDYIRTATEQLSALSQAMGSSLYATATSSATSDEGVEEAEIVDEQ